MRCQKGRARVRLDPHFPALLGTFGHFWGGFCLSNFQGKNSMFRIPQVVVARRVLVAARRAGRRNGRARMTRSSQERRPHPRKNEQRTTNRRDPGRISR